MPRSLSHEHLRWLRLRAQRLVPRPDSPCGVVQVVQELCGLQAQDPQSATLSVRVRGTGLVVSDVEHARLNERSVVRTWGMRGTLHLLATGDLAWLLSLLGPVFTRATRRRRLELGLDEETTARGIRMLRDILASRGPLTRVEIVEQLAVHGIRLEGQAAPHLISYAALEGIVCCGPDRGGKPAYVLLDDWADCGRALPREDALAELARRYLAAYGPAGPHDLAAWSGLSMDEVRTAWKRIKEELIEVDVAGRPAAMLRKQAGWLDEPPPCSPVVRLLPSFDTYLLGYRGRDLVVAPEHARRIHPGGGLLHPALLVDGRAVGTWRIKRQRERLDMIVEPFDTLAPDVHAGLAAEVADVGRFLDCTATLHMATA